METVYRQTVVVVAVLGAGVMLLGGSMGLPCADCTQSYPADGVSQADVPGLAVKCLECRLSRPENAMRHRCPARQSQTWDSLRLAECQPTLEIVTSDYRSTCARWPVPSPTVPVGIVLLI
jgi:hypothetical protein